MPEDTRIGKDTANKNKIFFRNPVFLCSATSEDGNKIVWKHELHRILEETGCKPDAGVVYRFYAVIQ